MRTVILLFCVLFGFLFGTYVLPYLHVGVIYVDTLIDVLCQRITEPASLTTFIAADVGFIFGILLGMTHSILDSIFKRKDKSNANG